MYTRRRTSHAHIHAHYAHVHACTGTHALCTRSYAHVHVHTYTWAHIHASTHDTHEHAQMHVNMHTSTHEGCISRPTACICRQNSVFACILCTTPRVYLHSLCNLLVIRWFTVYSFTNSLKVINLLRVCTRTALFCMFVVGTPLQTAIFCMSLVETPLQTCENNTSLVETPLRMHDLDASLVETPLRDAEICMFCRHSLRNMQELHEIQGNYPQIMHL